MSDPKWKVAFKALPLEEKIRLIRLTRENRENLIGLMTPEEKTDLDGRSSDPDFYNLTKMCEANDPIKICKTASKMEDFDTNIYAFIKPSAEVARGQYVDTFFYFDPIFGWTKTESEYKKMHDRKEQILNDQIEERLKSAQKKIAELENDKQITDINEQISVQRTLVINDPKQNTKESKAKFKKLFEDLDNRSAEVKKQIENQKKTIREELDPVLAKYNKEQHDKLKLVHDNPTSYEKWPEEFIPTLEDIKAKYSSTGGKKKSRRSKKKSRKTRRRRSTKK